VAVGVTILLIGRLWHLTEGWFKVNYYPDSFEHLQIDGHICMSAPTYHCVFSWYNLGYYNTVAVAWRAKTTMCRPGTVVK